MLQLWISKLLKLQKAGKRIEEVQISFTAGMEPLLVNH